MEASEAAADIKRSHVEVCKSMIVYVLLHCGALTQLFTVACMLVCLFVSHNDYYLLFAFTCCLFVCLFVSVHQWRA